MSTFFQKPLKSWNARSNTYNLKQKVWLRYQKNKVSTIYITSLLTWSKKTPFEKLINFEDYQYMRTSSYMRGLFIFNFKFIPLRIGLDWVLAFFWSLSSNYTSSFYMRTHYIYSQICVERPPMGPQNNGRCCKVVVVVRWSLS